MKIKTLIVVAAGIFFAAVTKVGAAGELAVQLQQPKSPSSTNSFKITFVALDRLNRSVTVQCYKKGPSDGGFVAFGSPITLINGGNSSNCSVDSSLVNTNGTYTFKVLATAGADSVESNIVSVDYNADKPGTPSGYGKDRNSCSVKINFTTANDSGKTVKVELYRSEALSFGVDNGSRVDSMSIGSNSNGQFNHSVPDCNKEYYFAIRAFSSSGAGSDVIGDQNIVITNTTTTNTTTTTTTAANTTPPQGAIATTQNSVAAPAENNEVTEAAPATEGEVNQGSNAESSTAEEPGKVLGATTDKGVFATYKNAIIGGVSLLLFILAVFLMMRKKRTV